MKLLDMLLLSLSLFVLETVSRKVWNTRFVAKARQSSFDGSVTDEMCRNRDLSADKVMGDRVDGHAVRDVMSSLVDKGDQQRFLEVLKMLPSVSKLPSELDSWERDDMGVVMIVTSFIKGLKKVKRSVKQGQQLIHAASGLKGLVSTKGLLQLVIALNITLTLNMSGNEVGDGVARREEDEFAMQALRDYTLVTLNRCLQDLTPMSLDAFIADLRSGILLYGPYDNLLRLRSSLLQRPRDQVTYTHALDGLGMVDAMVRDKRVELLALLVLQDVHSALSLSTAAGKQPLDSEVVLKCLERVGSGELSHAMYVEASQLLDTLSEGEEDDSEAGWCHSHYDSAVGIVRGSAPSKGLGSPQRQLEGGDWRSCKRLYGPLLAGALRGVARAQRDAWLDGDEQGSVGDGNFATLKSSGAHSHVLVVGDGDLSFSASLLRQQQQVPGPDGDCTSSAYTVTATVLETAEEVQSRYTGSEANIAFISGHPRGSLGYEVDATNLTSSLAPDLVRGFDTFIFNYPFADAGDATNSADGQSFSTRQVAVGRHQDLLSSFLHSVRQASQEGGKEVHVCISLLAHQALAWDLEQTASDAGFSLATVYPFNEKLHRALGYKRRRSYSNDPFRQFSSGYATNVVEGWVFALKMDR